jgi:hypothetical protein
LDSGNNSDNQDRVKDAEPLPIWFRERFLWAAFAGGLFFLGIWIGKYLERKAIIPTLESMGMGNVYGAWNTNPFPPAMPFLWGGLAFLGWIAIVHLLGLYKRDWVGNFKRRRIQAAADTHTLTELILQADSIGTGGVYRAMRVAVPLLGHEKLVEELATFGDARLIVPMAEVLNAPSKLRSAARDILVRLLPDITPENSHTLAKSSLYFHMSSPAVWQEGDEKLVTCTLDTIERVGGLGALPHLRRLLTEDDLPDDVRTQATRCLHAITARENLLRPSSPTAQEVEILLRSAQNNPAESALLLRPGSDA